MRRFSGWQITCGLWLLILAASALCGRADAQTAHPSQDKERRNPDAVGAADGTIPALLVSDIHFDPFHDPGRVQQLVHAPISQWIPILRPPSSPQEQQAFAALQQTCHVRGIDTPYALLRSSLEAMRVQQPDAKFITVSGDLIAHSFSCKYATLFPHAAAGDYQAFVLKAISFVVEQLRADFPGGPVYVALGNNDTGCGDYRLDANSEFLARTGEVVATGVPPSEQDQVKKEFAAGGYYSVLMGAPMRGTRLLVVNDLFMSPTYSTCAGKPDPAPAMAQLAWLREQLAQARRMGQKVWVMGHIPTGIDPYSTMARFKDVCGSESAAMFLTSDKLADLLVEYADVVRLGIFAHSHMDEIRLLKADGNALQGSSDKGVAVKLVPSISPVDGNNPSFMVAQVNPVSAFLWDYAVIAASNQTGIGTTWSREYDYVQAYRADQFSPVELEKLIGEFRQDRRGTTAESEEYIRDYFVGGAPELKPFWPQYVCSMANHTAKGFAACVCSAAK
jgi:sphingomyelin phosphodiesterase acid-like 3